MTDKKQQSGSTPKPQRKGRLMLTLAALAIVLILALSLVATYSYLTADAGTRNNLFASNEVQIYIAENGSPVGNTNTLPLGEGTKEVAVGIPSGYSDAAIRVTFTPQMVAAAQPEGETDTIYQFFDAEPLSAPNSNNKVVMGDITLHFASDWSSHWTFRDGYFYYNSILAAGSETPALLTGITYGGQSADTLEVVVSAEGLQPGPGAALEEWGLESLA